MNFKLFEFQLTSSKKNLKIKKTFVFSNVQPAPLVSKMMSRASVCQKKKKIT